MDGYSGYMALLPLWLAAVAGWAVVAAGLGRGLTGQARRAALVAHVMTPFAAVLLCSMLGFGLLYTVIGITAEWWALAVVTGLRAERFVAGGGLWLLAAWSLAGVATAYAGVRLVF